MKKKTVLIVDDAEINRSMLADMLADEFNILEASNGLEAVALLNKESEAISLVLLDIVMPVMDGFDVLAVMNRNGLINEIPVIMISAEKSSVMIDHSYDLGATEYINRPFDPKTVRRRVKNTIMLYSKQKNLENMVLEQMMQREKSNLIMVELLSHIVEFRNGESGLHVLNIRIITDLILKRLATLTDKYDLTPSRINIISLASIMHDIGKISIDEKILNKPGRLTAEEYEVIKTHSAIGAEMLESTSYYQSEELVQVARDVCRWHHERYDGKGYPDGLKGDDIPIGAQAVALADVYDALTHERVYKPAYSHEKSVQMILDGEAGAFNPLLLQCLQDIGTELVEKLKYRSAGRMSKAELQISLKNFLNKGEASNRTLALLENERTKNQFFASMSNEIQFEYTYGSDVLVMSEFGSTQYGFPEVIVDPKNSEFFRGLTNPKEFEEFLYKIKSVEGAAPLVQQVCQLNINNHLNWFKVIARPLWSDDQYENMTGIIGKFVDVNVEQVSIHKLREESQKDDLTGLYNVGYARQKIDEALKANQQKYALALFGPVNFKNLTDSYGLLFGDEVLKTLSAKVQKVLDGKKDAFAARVGGHEMLLFTKFDDATRHFIHKLDDKINCNVGGQDVNVTVGIAIAPEDGQTYEELFICADRALFVAKQYGEKYCYYESPMMELLKIAKPSKK